MLINLSRTGLSKRRGMKLMPLEAKKNITSQIGLNKSVTVNIFEALCCLLIYMKVILM